MAGESEQRPQGSERDHYRTALLAVLRGSALPYGYTLTVWTSGAVLARSRGIPTVGQVFLFLLGGVAAFAALGALATRGPRQPITPVHGDLIRTGMVHVFAVSAAVGAAALVALVPGGGAWVAGSFTATAVYMLLASLELVLARRELEQAPPSERAAAFEDAAGQLASAHERAAAHERPRTSEA